jgi:hypothetical protein
MIFEKTVSIFKNSTSSIIALIRESVGVEVPPLLSSVVAITTIRTRNI